MSAALRPRGARKKKAPGKAVSQGGRGQQPYPGAIGRTRDERHDSSRSATHLACIRSVPPASLPTDRFVVRRKATGFPRADPSTWTRRVLFRSPLFAGPSPSFGVRHLRSISVVRRENMEIAKSGQGRFLPLFFPRFSRRARGRHPRPVSLGFARCDPLLNHEHTASGEEGCRRRTVRSTAQKKNRVGGGVAAPVLPQHRTYGSVYGASS